MRLPTCTPLLRFPFYSKFMKFAKPVTDSVKLCRRSYLCTLDKIKTRCRTLVRFCSVTPSRGTDQRLSMTIWVPVAVIFFACYYDLQDEAKLKQLEQLLTLLQIRASWVLLAAKSQGSDVLNLMSGGGKFGACQQPGIVRICCHPHQIEELASELQNFSQTCEFCLW